MARELTLASVAQAIAAWRKTKQHRTSVLPSEIAAHIRELAKYHKRSHIAAALKMSGTTVNKVLKMDHFEAPLVNKRQRASKKGYRLEEKVALCEEWKRSGMGIEQFCKAKGISKSALYRWRCTLTSQLNNKSKDWVLVKPAQESELSAQNEVLIELTLPNQCIASIKLSRTQAVSFFQELYHAIAAVR